MATATEDAARQIAARWGFGDAELSRLSGGLINQTFAVKRGGAPVAVLQQLHPIFGAEVNLDLDAVTAHVAARGLVTPRLLRTQDGAAWAVDEDDDGAGAGGGGPAATRVWRALSWVEGRCVATAPELRWAEAGGALVGRFHQAVADLAHDYHFSRGNVHDTARYFARLRALLEAGEAAFAPSPGSPAAAPPVAPELAAQIVALGHDVLAAAAALSPLPATPPRHCHGDLKLSNLLFTPESGAPGAEVRGLCLVDLDTLCRGTIAFELGDAMRSWCNPAGEDTAETAFDLELFGAAMRGYRGVADALLDDAERASIVVGLHTVCVELAARFCIDAFEDRYFGWSPERHPSRRHHNLVRAQSQLTLARSVAARLDEAHQLARGALG
jgi:Ser/Thr protein kinase RdoA (MazF antagonist)